MAGICSKPRRASPIGRTPGGISSWSISTLMPVLYCRGPRVSENAYGAPVIDEGALGGNSFDGILGGQYRRHPATLTRALAITCLEADNPACQKTTSPAPHRNYARNSYCRAAPVPRPAPQRYATRNV